MADECTTLQRESCKKCDYIRTAPITVAITAVMTVGKCVLLRAIKG